MGSFKVLAPCTIGLVGLLFAGCVQGSDAPEMGQAKLLKGGWAPTGTANDYAASGGAGSAVGPSDPGAPNDPSKPAGVNPGVSGNPAGAAAPPPSGGSTALGGAGGSVATAGTGAAGTRANPAGAGGAGGAGGTNGMAGSGVVPAPTGQPGTLTVEVTSSAPGGRYAPRNVGAIWIETGSGQFVKTIERWAGIRVGDLRGWNGASGGWGFSFFGTSSSPDAVDAVSAATSSSHKAHNPTWAMKDVDGMVVPDGTYKVVLEVADGSNGTAEVMFQKGPMPQTVSAPAGGRGYSSFTVTYTP